MVLHDTSEDLPPLRKKKNRGQTKIESDETVDNLIKSKLLLDLSFNKLYLDISKKSQEMLKIIDSFHKSDFSKKDILSELDFADDIPKRILNEVSESLAYKDQLKFIEKSLEAYQKENQLTIQRIDSIKSFLDKKEKEIIELEVESNDLRILIDNKDIEKISDKSIKKINEDYLKLTKKLNELYELQKEKQKILNKEERSLKEVSSIIKDSEKKLNEFQKKAEKSLNTYKIILKELLSASAYIQKKIDTFERDKKIELDILSTTVIYSCEKCGYVVSLGRFREVKCICKNKISKVSDTKNHIVHHFNQDLINFIKKNLWLEFGTEYLLKRKGYNTWVGYHILGHSGIWHEIDNIAEYKKNNQWFRVFCECKSGAIGANDILVFSGKLTDIGFPNGYIFTSSNQDTISAKISRLAKAKNIKIISGLLEKVTDDLLDEIN